MFSWRLPNKANRHGIVPTQPTHSSCQLASPTAVPLGSALGSNHRAGAGRVKRGRGGADYSINSGETAKIKRGPFITECSNH
jgi:hypothetical protein